MCDEYSLLGVTYSYSWRMKHGTLTEYDVPKIKYFSASCTNNLLEKVSAMKEGNEYSEFY